MNSTVSMRWKTSAIITAFLIGLASIAFLLAMGGPQSNQLAAAQAPQTSSAITVNQTAATSASNNFTASGTIGGTVPATSESSSSAGSSAASSYILSGDWSVRVSKGNVTDFKAGFVMVKTDGSGYHVHNVTGFKVGNNTNFMLNPTGMATINGTSDVSVNGTIKWPGAHGTLSINKLLVMSLNLSSADTSNHFSGQPIYGTVTKMTSLDGTQIVGPSSTSTSGKGAPGGLGGILGNITKPLQNLFGGGNKTK